MCNAPPTLPGTPISPSMPPRFRLAHSITVVPRLATAGTSTRLPWNFNPSGVRPSCRTTSSRRPSSTTKRFVPPPSSRQETPRSRRYSSNSGSRPRSRIRIRSAGPPTPRDVCAARGSVGRQAAPRAATFSAIPISRARDDISPFPVLPALQGLVTILEAARLRIASPNASATFQTLPAPMVSTKSPGCASASTSRTTVCSDAA